MSTKNNPGEFDCYTRAEPDEEMFVLLGRDPIAPALVYLWAETARRLGKDPKKIEEALGCAERMASWAESKNEKEKLDAALTALMSVLKSFWDENEIERLREQNWPKAKA